MLFRLIGVVCNINKHRGCFRNNAAAHLGIEGIEISEVESRLNGLAHTSFQKHLPGAYPSWPRRARIIPNGDKPLDWTPPITAF
jgi:hypothetical protein